MTCATMYRSLFKSLLLRSYREAGKQMLTDSRRNKKVKKVQISYREESTQAINLLWILWSSIFVQFHHELFAANEAKSQFQTVWQPQNASICWAETVCRCACMFVLLNRYSLYFTVSPFKAVMCALRLLGVPDLFGLATVVQRKEDICILADAVVSEALQVDEEVVRHRDTATVTMALSYAITLRTKKKVTAHKTTLQARPNTCHSVYRYVY